MRTVLVAGVAGVIFALGLAISGMTDPAKVEAFLDLGGGWDPSLAFVMGGAIGVHALAYVLQRRLPGPLGGAPGWTLAPLSGVDVSKYQHSDGKPINWAAVKRSGVDFAFIKATGGSNRVDPCFTREWAAAGRAGMIRGQQFYLTSDFSSGYGFDGLVVGLLSRGSAVGVVIGALLFGFLRSGSINMEITAHVPSAVVLICQGLIVIFIAGSAIFTNRKANR